MELPSGLPDVFVKVASRFPAQVGITPLEILRLRLHSGVDLAVHPWFLVGEHLD